MCQPLSITSVLFFFNDPPTTEIYTLSLHDALPIFSFTWVKGHGDDKFNDVVDRLAVEASLTQQSRSGDGLRSEEHTSELQSRRDLVCRLLLEKKKKKKRKQYT